MLTILNMHQSCEKTQEDIIGVSKKERKWQKKTETRVNIGLTLTGVRKLKEEIEHKTDAEVADVTCNQFRQHKCSEPDEHINAAN